MYLVLLPQDRAVGPSSASEVQQVWLRFCLCPPGHVTSLSHSFLICKVKIIVALTSRISMKELKEMQVMTVLVIIFILLDSKLPEGRAYLLYPSL